MKKILILIGLLITSMNLMAQDSTPSLETVYQKFSFTLFNKVADDVNKNVILSPLSAQIALSMLENGAVGKTLSEMQEALGTTECLQPNTGQATHLPTSIRMESKGGNGRGMQRRI